MRGPWPTGDCCTKRTRTGIQGINRKRDNVKHFHILGCQNWKAVFKKILTVI
jgi:hypothetical protein